MISLSSWTHDFRLTLRSLRRSPGFAAVAVGTLAVAIGANAGIFSVVDAVLLKPLPFPAPDRVVYIAGSAPGTEFPDEFGVSAEFYVHYGEESRLLERVSGYNTGTATLRVGDRAERVLMGFATWDLFRTLGVMPMIGRLPQPEDDNQVIVLSHAAWTSWFGADRDVINRSYYAAGQSRTVIGVMPPGFWFPGDDVLLWVPGTIRAEDIVPGRFGLNLVARLAPGADLESLPAELTLLNRQLPERFGGTPRYGTMMQEQFRPVVRSMDEQLLGDVRGPLWVLLASVAIVLIIACTNVANLFFVRAERRMREMAVRRALGAGRRALMRLGMAEAGLVALLAGALAVALAAVTVPLFIRVAPGGIPRLDRASINAATLLFTLGASLFTALLCGLIPALRSSVPGLERLRDAGRGAIRGRHRGRNGLVAAQTALALVLLIGSGLLIRSFRALRAVDPGYDTEDVFTFQFAPERDDLHDGPTWASFHLDFMDRIRALPGVERVGIVDNVPLDEGVSSGRWLTDATASDAEGGALVYNTVAGGDYFETMGIDLVQGRGFRRTDATSDLGNVVVSRSAAELLWPGQNPIGRRLRERDWDQWQTVVGVVGDVLQYDFRDTPLPMIYLPLRGPTADIWWVSSPAYVVKTARAGDIAPEIRSMIREVAPAAPMYRVYTMKALAARSTSRLSFTMLTLAVAAGLALILGAIGLFGVLSYVVAQRTREIGLRMALGAEAQRVQRMIVAQGARVVLAGVVVGVLVSLASTSLLRGLLFGVEPLDPGTFATMSITMVGVGLAASYLPARRASSVDPAESLREG